jgi:hypothetical protein
MMNVRMDLLTYAPEPSESETNGNGNGNGNGHSSDTTIDSSSIPYITTATGPSQPIGPNDAQPLPSTSSIPSSSSSSASTSSTANPIVASSSSLRQSLFAPSSSHAALARELSSRALLATSTRPVS